MKVKGGEEMGISGEGREETGVGEDGGDRLSGGGDETGIGEDRERG